MRNKLIVILSFVIAMILSKLNYPYLSYNESILLTLNPGAYLGDQASISQLLISTIALYIYVLMLYNYINDLFNLEVYIFARGSRFSTITHYVHKTIGFCTVLTVFILLLFVPLIFLEDYNSYILIFLILNILTIYILGMSVLLTYILSMNQKIKRQIPLLYFLFFLILNLLLKFENYRFRNYIQVFNWQIVLLLILCGVIIILILTYIIYKRYSTIDRIG